MLHENAFPASFLMHETGVFMNQLKITHPETVDVGKRSPTLGRELNLIPQDTKNEVINI